MKLIFDFADDWACPASSARLDILSEGWAASDKTYVVLQLLLQDFLEDGENTIIQI